MGRDSMYPYEHFMLFDKNAFTEDTDGELRQWTYLRDSIQCAFDAMAHTKYLRSGHEADIFAYTNRLEIGWDSSGGFPCLFVEPQVWHRSNQVLGWHTPIPFKIGREVQTAFRRLIRLYPNYWRYPTSGYTSKAYSPNDLYLSEKGI